MKSYTYRIIIEPDERGTFHGYVPALPGCHTWGESIEETRANIRDALSVYLASLIDDGEPVPTEQGLESFETVTVGQPEKIKAYA